MCLNNLLRKKPSGYLEVHCGEVELTHDTFLEQSAASYSSCGRSIAKKFYQNLLCVSTEVQANFLLNSPIADRWREVGSLQKLTRKVQAVFDAHSISQYRQSSVHPAARLIPKQNAHFHSPSGVKAKQVVL